MNNPLIENMESNFDVGGNAISQNMRQTAQEIIDEFEGGIINNII